MPAPTDCTPDIWTRSATRVLADAHASTHQCERHVDEKTPVPLGSDAMSASTCAWKAFTNANCAGVLGARLSESYCSCTGKTDGEY